MKLASPSPSYKLTDLPWPGQGFPRRPQSYGPPLFLCKPIDNDDVTAKMLLGKLGFRWVSTHAKECVKSSARMWWEDLCTVPVMTHHASHGAHCIQRWICLSFPPFWRYQSWGLVVLLLLQLEEWQRHRHTKRVVKPCCMTCKYSFPETTYFLWNCAFLFQMKGRASSDWWGQSACNKLVSYFTVQPLKRLVKCTSGSAPFLNDMCVFRGPMVWTCSFDGSGTIQRDLWFCSGIRVPTHSCSSVKRGEAGGGEMCNPHSQNSSPPTQIWCEPI